MARHTLTAITTFSHILQRIAVALLAVSLLVLPASNSGLPWAHLPMQGILYAAFVFWCVSRALAWRAPQGHERWLWAAAGALLSFGWLMTFFPSALVDRASGVILELDKSPWLAFGTVDKAASIHAMSSISAALVILVMSVDVAHERQGRLILALAVMASGFGAAVMGLCFQTPADLSRLWEVKQIPDTVFGLFWYHGNAAAYLNLCWPVALWLCVILLRREERRLPQQMALAGLVVGLAAQMVAVFANVSKMGHFLMILEVSILAAAGFFAWRRQDAHEHETVGKRAWLLAALGAGILIAGAWMAGAATGWHRWGVFAGKNFDDPARRHAAEMALKIGWDGGWNGTGPGTFEWVSAHYSVLDPVLKDGRWRHAHNDYAQFFAEWGWMGTLLVLALLGPAAVRYAQGLRQALSADSTHRMSFQRRAGLLCFGTALVSVLVHAVVDFPLQIPAIRCIAAAVLGMALAMSHSTTDSRPRASTRKIRRRSSSARDILPQADGRPEGSSFF